MDRLQDIVNLYYQMNEIYLELYKLELSDRKNDIVFIELVNGLKKFISQEKRLFNKLDKEYDGSYNDLCDLLRIQSDPFSRRIVDYIEFNNDLDIEIYEEEDEDIVAEKLDDIRYAKLSKACFRNVFLMYLSFIQEYIDSESFDGMKEQLLNFKYHNSFINHDIEDTLVNFNFNVSRVNYIDLYLVADTLGLEPDECDEIILNCYRDTISLTIEQLLSINDEDYLDKNKKAISINNQCMLRTVLSLLSESDYELVKNIIFNKVNECSNENNRVSVDIVNSIVSNRKKDKSRVRKITIRPDVD